MSETYSLIHCTLREVPPPTDELDAPSPYDWYLKFMHGLVKKVKRRKSKIENPKEKVI